MTYKIIVQLYECDKEGKVYSNPILEQECPERGSIQEAYDAYDSKKLFDIYLSVDESVKKAVKKVEDKIHQSEEE